MRRLRARALSAVCPLVVMAVLGPVSRARGDQPCPALDTAKAVAASVRDKKEVERALEAALAECAPASLAASIPPSQYAAPPPSIDWEVEPNDQAGTPMSLQLANGVGIVAGEISGPGDVDFYRFFAPSVGRIWIQTDSGGFQQPGSNARDTTIDLYQQDGTTLIESDDDDGTGTGGDDTVESQQSSSIAGRTIPATAVYVRVKAFGAGMVIRPYRILVLFTATPGTPESEPNNTAGTADVLSPPLALATGSINAAGDADYYSIALLAGSVLVVSADADPNRDGNGADLVVEIRNSADQIVISMDSSDSGSVANFASEASTYTVPADGTYYVKVHHYSASGTGAYDLAVGTVSINPKPVLLWVDQTGNGVWEPGETAKVIPSWSNEGPSSISFTGALVNLDGPPGATYAIPQFVSDYGTIPAGAAGNCGLNCYSVSVTNPASRPAVHWDASALELISNGDSTKWDLHIGGSFADVPSSNLFYYYVETILHHAVTGGCTATTYCPGNPALRKQMAVFVLKAMYGSTYNPPPASGIFTDVPAADPFAKWIEDLYNKGVVAGCGAGPTYCPDNAVNRQQMSVFLLKTLEGPGYVPPACTGVFADVPCSNPFAIWIEELYDRQIAAGCGGGNFCPTNPTTRAQMAPFLSNTFGLKLYGP